MTEAALRKALAQSRDAYFAEMVTILVGLAAETHPDEIRKALASVFDLEGVKDTTDRMMSVINHTQRIAQEARELATQINLQLDAIEMRLDSLQHDTERLYVAKPAANGIPQRQVTPK